ncbi:uracil-DNA glycosylase [Halegenticoccus soli]|uniref:uracil-DNA glycosylase n=1 Tax=Halegenticoccus soli TaxID=1985678 RepID=UPI000C6EE9F4|nr:uracil-DNA glycosylase [Halegenticoccus soli]
MPTHPRSDERNVLEPGCARCPALADSRTRISWGNGPSNADVMVVGEAPGAGDPDAETWKGGNHTGFAYTSRHSGRRIRALFDDLDYGDRTYYTNAVKCFPRGDGGSNREPTRAELENCRTHLEAEIEAVDPAVVVATGKHATRTVLAFEGRDLDGFLDAVLDPVDCPALGVRLLPILHPSYQEVWLSRLGYAPEEYREAIASHLP